MRDPFPFEPPQLLRNWGQTIANATGLQALPAHIHEVLFAALFYHSIGAFVSPVISKALFPKRYPALARKTKLNWDVHVVSLVQSVTIVLLAFYTLYHDTKTGERKYDFRDRIWAYSGGNALIQSFATGYFLWDLYISIRYVKLFGIGLLAHAISALWVYALGYRLFTVPYAPIFILYELSSPFLNVHWFCDKLDLTGSPVQFYNGIMLIATFFGSRLVWGLYHSVVVFSDIWKCYHYQNTVEGKAWMATTRWAADIAAKGLGDGVGPMRIPWWLAATYLVSNVTLTGLNFFWFGKMIETIRARFEPPLGTKGTKRSKTVSKSDVKKENGTSSVHIEGVEPVKRPGSSGGARTRRRG